MLGFSCDNLICFPSLCQEWSKHKIRTEVFGVVLDDTLAKAVAKTLHTARVTLSERNLLDAVEVEDKKDDLGRTSSTNLALATDQCNASIRSWGQVGITFQDMHPKLWACVQAITSGKPLKE